MPKDWDAGKATGVRICVDCDHERAPEVLQEDKEVSGEDQEGQWNAATSLEDFFERIGKGM